eukprot:5999946-Amphidinium_carterae.2
MMFVFDSSEASLASTHFLCFQEQGDTMNFIFNCYEAMEEGWLNGGRMTSGPRGKFTQGSPQTC